MISSLFSNKTLKYLILLIFIFIISMTSLIIVHLYITSSIEKLNKKTEKLESQIQIGEYFIIDLYKLRSDFYELITTATNRRGEELINEKINKRIKSLEEALNILEFGGTFKKVVKLNMDGHINSIKIITLNKDKNDIPLAVINVRPRLQEFKQMLFKVNSLLKQQSLYEKNSDTKNYIKQYKEIKRFYKTTPSFFIRITETSNRLLHDASIRLNKIEKEIEEQKEQYIKLELILIIIFLYIAISLGIIIAIQINKNVELLKRQEQFTREILDSQDSIVIVSDQEKIIDANKALIDFFDEYDNLSDFSKKHNCICDFFEKNEDKDFIVGKIHKNMPWYEYIINNPSEQHKVAITKNKKINYFLVTVISKNLDKDNTIRIVTLHNITEEIKVQKELKKLNENLEDIVNKKTEDLQELNKTLENKIEIEIEKNREKDRAIIQQSRFAALGEMLENIAHQWRQPLSGIYSIVTSMQVQLELKIASNKDIETSYISIIKYLDFLNQTIEDFRGYFSKDKQKENFNILEKLENAISIIKPIFKSNTIKIVYDIKKNSYKIVGLPNELSQVFLNILNNAKDVLIERVSNDKIVLIKVYEDTKSIFIEITDSAGGIKKDIIEKIFDPYFTTKHQSQGTGIGLYMNKHIVETSMNGKISVSNETFTYEDKSYKGACFKIQLPKF